MTNYDSNTKRALRVRRYLALMSEHGLIDPRRPKNVIPFPMSLVGADDDDFGLPPANSAKLRKPVYVCDFRKVA